LYKRICVFLGISVNVVASPFISKAIFFSFSLNEVYVGMGVF
jgi:hypothetical protein